MDKRTIITVVLCFAVLSIWGKFIAPMFERPVEVPQSPAIERPVDTSDVKPPSFAAPEPAPKPDAGQPDAGQPETATTEEAPAASFKPAASEKRQVQYATISNENLTLKTTSVGGSIFEAWLNNFQEDGSSDQPLRLLAPITKENSLAMQLKGYPQLAQQHFEVVETGDRHVVYQTTVSNLRITKTISLPDGAYNADVSVKLENMADQALQLTYQITSAAGILPELPEWEKNGSKPLSELPGQDIEGVIGARTGGDSIKVISTAPGKVQKEPFVYDTTNVGWAGVRNRYFSAALQPLQNDVVASAHVTPVGKTNLATSLMSRSIRIEPKETVEDNYMLYIGPSSDAVLGANPAYSDLEGLHHVPWPAPVTKLFLAILHGFHSVVRNYGMAIILLTLLVRIALHPLTRKSQKSMHEMQQLGPQMKEIKEKYKDDKKRQQEEIMKLYREHGVNPMGGCLPIILQLPILIGLYGALRSSIALRQAPFLLWMKDLSQPDALAMLPEWFPIQAGGPFNLLPLLMIVAMFFQQKFTPRSPSADPQAEQTQKMMMYLMPVMFGFIFYSMPSGLVLYFMTSTALGALESHLIRRHLNKVQTVPSRAGKKESWVERAAKAKGARGRKIK